jgi:hypothetical protein
MPAPTSSNGNEGKVTQTESTLAYHKRVAGNRDGSTNELNKRSWGNCWLCQQWYHIPCGYTTESQSVNRRVFVCSIECATIVQRADVQNLPGPAVLRLREVLHECQSG